MSNPSNLNFHRNSKNILGCCIPTLRRSFLRMGYKERLLGGFIRSRQASQTSRLNREDCYRRRYCPSQQGGPPQERQLKNYFSLLNTKFQTKYKLLLQSLKKTLFLPVRGVGCIHNLCFIQFDSRFHYSLFHSLQQKGELFFVCWISNFKYIRWIWNDNIERSFW